MDYYKIGQQIRKYRKAYGYSQEHLAELTGISVTHMSHIETGNTKLSLQVLADISRALDVSADELLCERSPKRSALFSELEEVLENCTVAQLRILIDIIKAAKTALNKHLD